MLVQLLIIGGCILWLLICARIWLLINANNKWQRHLIAAAAGLGAALIYMFGQMAAAALLVDKRAPIFIEGSEGVRVSPGAPKKESGKHD